MIAQDTSLNTGAGQPATVKPATPIAPATPAQPAGGSVTGLPQNAVTTSQAAPSTTATTPTTASTSTTPSTDTSVTSQLPASVPLPNSPTALSSIVGPTSSAGNGNTFVDGTLNPTAGNAPAESPSPVLGGAPATSLAPGVNTTPVNPVDDLTSQLITPGPATDRYSIAQQQLATYNQATDPLYQAALREADSTGAASGQLDSGQLRSSIGNVVNARNNDLETQGQTFLQNALTGSIQDAYNNIGIAQQQQAYQSAQQNQTFNQGITTADTQSQLTNTALNEALAELAAGDSGSPADYQALLSQIFGTDATQAGNALTGLTTGTVNNNAQTAATQALQQYLASLSKGATS